MCAQVTRSQAGLKRIWVVGVLLPAAVVVAVWQGLPLPWAIPALTLAPLFVVVIIERGTVGRPDRFAIR